MVTVNSISGGKTSSYLAYHYPADYNVFSLIRIEDVNCMPKDKKLVQMVSDRIGMDFIATAEDDLTLTAVFELEQLIGKKIRWLTGVTFDELIRTKKALPNQSWRFCTTKLKMEPIFEWWQRKFNEIILMRVGYRYDEMERKDSFSTSFKTIVGKSKNGERNKWAEIQWRLGEFPMIDDKINHYQVKVWADSTGIEYPLDSNCVGCFWKQPQQLRKNWDTNTNKMNWFSGKEIKRRWKKEAKYSSIRRLLLQSDFQFGTGAGCTAGECTN